MNQYDFLELNRSQLHPIQFVDEENSDELYKGQYGSRSVTIKYVTTNSRVIDKFLAEANIMKRLSHENFVRLYGVCTEKTTNINHHRILSQWIFIEISSSFK